MVHVKDSAGPPDNKMVDVGKGTIDFRAIFAQSEKAGIKHYFVEHDQPRSDRHDPQQLQVSAHSEILIATVMRTQKSEELPQ